MFLQVPLPHGWRSHSSISEKRTETTRERALTSDTKRLICAPAGPQAEPLTHAHALIGGGLEAVVAGAAVAALRVDTVTVATHVWDLLALVPICGDRLQTLTGA